MKAFENMNSVVLGISRDSTVSHVKFIEKFQLPFLLLSDPEELACRFYGVLKEKNMYGKVVIGIERSTFIIDEKGNIEKIYRKVKVEGHAENIINYLNSK